ncbi:hypothetical protein [Hymenobacter properus]|uniref:Lipocalin-like domain-containing protein n=1 Tax=Hymenobacter properus TaxID=2791026 RepID=A0A931BKR9_9BACT|nr:hypothetical protein [Hymenobacter properus]MBF9143246.1 hypothetical protein [Hymenobacter properus]MBR7722056.1 hypothetical protein [Microvirga sp. SRT04]
MKRYLFPLVLLSLTACGKKDNPPPADPASIVGTWHLQTRRQQQLALPGAAVPSSDRTLAYATVTYGTDGTYTGQVEGVAFSPGGTYVLNGTALTTAFPVVGPMTAQVTELSATRLVVEQTDLNYNNTVRIITTTTATR